RGKENELWHQHGGEATIAAYNLLPPEIREVHIEFLESLQNYYLDDENRLFVHAGFTNLHGIIHEYYPRLAFWDRTLWELAVAMDENLVPGDKRYPKRMSLYKEIFIGH